MTTNELKLAKAFRDAGFPQDKAEAVSQTIFDAIRDNVATKSDVQLSAADLRREIQAVKLWLGGIVVAGFGIVLAAIGLLFAALHMWPPHT